MKKNLISVLLIVMILISVLPATAFANTVNYKYTDWQFNNDYTKITINGKTYNNYVVIYRVGNEITMSNIGSEYLLFPDEQEKMSPEEFFTNEIKKELNLCLGAIESRYPTMELLYINYKPWQETEFKDDYIKWFEDYYNLSHKSIPKDSLFSFLNDESNNGYAYEVFANKQDINIAKKNFTLEKLPVSIDPMNTYTSYQNFVNQGGWDGMWNGEAIKFNSYQDFLQEVKSSQAPSSSNSSTTNITLELYLNRKTVRVIQGNNTKDVTLDVAPINPKGTTLIPVRGVFEAIGAKVEWLPKTQQVKITKGNTTIVLTIGSKVALVNGEKTTMVEPAQIIKGRTMIPLRFVSENLGGVVKWFGSEQKIQISF